MVYALHIRQTIPRLCKLFLTSNENTVRSVDDLFYLLIVCKIKCV